MLFAALLAALAAPETALAAAGDLIPAFGAGGVVTSNPSVSADSIWKTTVLGTKLYAVGYDRVPGIQEWRIEQRDTNNGGLNPSFDLDGVVTNNPDGNNTTPEEAYAVTGDQAANELYIAGYDSPFGANTGGQWRIEKRNATSGSLIPAFGGAGAVTSNPANFLFEAAKAIALDASGIYVAGNDQSPFNDQWRIEKRSRTTGALINGFGTNGVIKSNPSFTSDQPSDIAIDATAIYVVGFDSNTVTSNSQWRIEKRRLDTGALIAAFDGDGVVTSNPSVSSDLAYAIAIDSTYMYVVGFDAGPGFYQWHIEKRRLDTGALDAAFDGDGIVTSSLCAANAVANSVAIDSTAIYVAGYDSCGSSSRWRVEKRNINTGALVGSFGAGGVALSDPTPSSDIPRSIAMDANAIYVAGEDGNGGLQWRIEKRDSGGGGGGGSFVDCGVSIQTGSGPVALSCEPSGTVTSQLRIYKGSEWRGLGLVPEGDPNASKLRIQTSSGVKALRKQ